MTFLQPVKFLEGELIHDLLTIFVSEKLPGYIHFYNNHKEFISSIGELHYGFLSSAILLRLSFSACFSFLVLVVSFYENEIVKKSS